MAGKSYMAIANKGELLWRLAKKMHLPSRFQLRDWDRLARRYVATFKNNICLSILSLCIRWNTNYAPSKYPSYFTRIAHPTTWGRQSSPFPDLGPINMVNTRSPTWDQSCGISYQAKSELSHHYLVSKIVFVNLI